MFITKLDITYHLQARFTSYFVDPMWCHIEYIKICTWSMLCCALVLDTNTQILQCWLTHWSWDKMATRQHCMNLLKISLTFVPKIQVNNIPALVQIKALRWPSNKTLSEPMMVSLLMHTYMHHLVPMSFEALELSEDCLGPSEAMLKNVGKLLTWMALWTPNITCTKQDTTKLHAYFMGINVPV